MANYLIYKSKFPKLTNFMITTWNQTAKDLYRDLKDAVFTYLDYLPPELQDDFLSELELAVSDTEFKRILLDVEGDAYKLAIGWGGRRIDFEKLVEIRNLAQSFINSRKSLSK